MGGGEVVVLSWGSKRLAQMSTTGGTCCGAVCERLMLALELAKRDNNMAAISNSTSTRSTGSRSNVCTTTSVGSEYCGAERHPNRSNALETAPHKSESALITAEI